MCNESSVVFLFWRVVCDRKTYLVLMQIKLFWGEEPEKFIILWMRFENYILCLQFWKKIAKGFKKCVLAILANLLQESCPSNFSLITQKVTALMWNSLNCIYC